MVEDAPASAAAMVPGMAMPTVEALAGRDGIAREPVVSVTMAMIVMSQ